MALTLLLVYNVSKEILQGISDYANQQYLLVLQDQFKTVRMLYEEGKIEEEVYRKLERDFAEAIKNIRIQQSKPKRQLDIKIV